MKQLDNFDGQFNPAELPVVFRSKFQSKFRRDFEQLSVFKPAPPMTYWWAPFISGALYECAAFMKITLGALLFAAVFVVRGC